MDGAQPVLGCNHMLPVTHCVSQEQSLILTCTMDSDTHKAGLGEPEINSKPAQNSLSHHYVLHNET